MLSLAMPLASAVTLAAASGLAANQNVAEQCAVALQVTKEIASQQYGKPIVFDVADGPYMHVQADALASGWERSEAVKTTEVIAPPRQLVGQFVATRENSVSRCRVVRAWLTKHRVQYGRAAVKAVPRRDVNDELPAGIFTVGLPSISRDGQMALVYTSDVWGDEAGGGFAHLYQRQRGGGWKSVIVRRLWIA